MLVSSAWISLRQPDPLKESRERLQPAWVLRSWGRGAAKEVCAELMQGVGCSCGNFHWRSILLWVDSELGALPSEPCQPGVTRANRVLLTLFLLLNKADLGLFVSCSSTLTLSSKSKWLTIVNSKLGNSTLIREIETKDTLPFGESEVNYGSV